MISKTMDKASDRKTNVKIRKLGNIIKSVFNYTCMHAKNVYVYMHTHTGNTELNILLKVTFSLAND